jgi:hypothetical protein
MKIKYRIRHRPGFRFEYAAEKKYPWWPFWLRVGSLGCYELVEEAVQAIERHQEYGHGDVIWEMEMGAR